MWRHGLDKVGYVASSSHNSPKFLIILIISNLNLVVATTFWRACLTAEDMEFTSNHSPAEIYGKERATWPLHRA